MADMIGRNQNTVSSANVGKVTVGSTTAVTLVAANSRRIAFKASINGEQNDRTVYIRYYAASVDNIKQGNVITKKLDEDGSFFRVCDEMSPDNIYTGEISAICESGSIDVNFTEY